MGPKGAASRRGGGRGRRRTTRGGSKGGRIEPQQRGGKFPIRASGRGASPHSSGLGLQPNFIIPPSLERNRPGLSKPTSDEENASNRRPSDYYLHKKFKKPTTTVVDESNSSSKDAASSSNLSSINGLNKSATDTGTRNGLVSQRNQSATDPSVIRQSSRTLENGSQSSSNSLVANASSTVGSSVVYKPKFRIASESDSESPRKNGNSSTTRQSNSSSEGQSQSNSSNSYSTTPGKVSKTPRLDRQSLDDRISKIIDENQSLLEWPEHFTKKLKSHTRHNSQSSNSSSSKTNQLIILSGGSTTELQSPKSSLQHAPLPPPNGIVRHPSFDLGSSGGTVELLTNPLIMKAQADMLKSSFSQSIPSSSPPIADLSFPLAVAANTPSIVVPKKRRRLSPTPSRLCGGEVSELPVTELSPHKSYYRDVDMNVRVNNCSGAKVTIRTSGASGGLVQSAVDFGRYMEPAVPSPLALDTSSLFFPSNSSNTSDLLLSKLDSKPLTFNPAKEVVRSAMIGSSKSKKGNSSRSFKHSPSEETTLPSKPKLSTSRDEPSNKIEGTTPQLPPKVSSNTISLPEEVPPVHFVPIRKTSCSPESEPATSISMDTKSLPSPLSSSSSFQVLPNNPKRPNFLALRPVAEVKKTECGVLPSPETPRVAKAYNQMSINGNAYTYLGFKVSTRSSYTCLFKPQPMFVPQSMDAKLSMYSTWQPCPKDPKDPDLNISTNDSRVNGRKDVKGLYTSANGKSSDTLTVSSPDKQPPISSPVVDKSPLAIFSKTKRDSNYSPVSSLSRSSEAVPITSQSIMTSTIVKSSFSNTTTAPRPHTSTSGANSLLSSSSDGSSADESCKMNRDDCGSKDDSSGDQASARVRIMEGGFESNEAYTYVRGRGRGRYVCEACGIRCKKPSMLRKHLKTHTDLRPYTCKLCNFSFKTKGNLTKHQKSKSHHKKCISMGIHPESSQSLASTGPNIPDSNSENESDDDDDDDMGDTDSQCDEGDASPSGNDSESVEKEIALSLLDLSRMSRRPSVGENGFGNQTNTQSQSCSEVSVNAVVTKHPLIVTNSEAPMDLSVKPWVTFVTREEPPLKRQMLDVNGIVEPMSFVSEAPQWKPEQNRRTNGNLSPRKVLNTLSRSSSNGKAIPASQMPLVLDREIKQEVPDYQGEVESRHCNGYSFEIFRKRQDSETSTASSSTSINGTCGPAATMISDLPQPSLSGNNHTPSAPLRLHQPWLSPPERKQREIDQKLEEIKVDVTPDKAHYMSPSDVNNVASDRESTSPNGKIFASAAKPQAEFRQPSGAQALVKEDGKAECNVCGKTFGRPSQLTLHMNIHYLERPFRCDPCGVSFRTKGHLIKHRRSSSHDCKVYLTEAWGVANEENPRPFKCPDCKIAFRIHGHLAKHLRSKMHIMRMECLGKLPFGIYFEMEKSGMNLNEIDTTDCDMSLVSLQNVAQKIYGESWKERLTAPIDENV